MDRTEPPERQVVAVTGGIGSGKSTASRLFASCGAVVVSADQLAREVVLPGSETLSAVVSAFGPSVLAADGSLDRRALGSIVFADPVKRKLLEDLTHPAIRARAAEQFEHALTSGTPLVVYDCPLLFESGLDALGFRAIVTVTAPLERCIERVVARDGLSPSEARERIAAQLPLEEKVRRSTHVLDNSGTPEALASAVAALYREFTADR